MTKPETGQFGTPRNIFLFCATCSRFLGRIAEGDEVPPCTVACVRHGAAASLAGEYWYDVIFPRPPQYLVLESHRLTAPCRDHLLGATYRRVPLERA